MQQKHYLTAIAVFVLLFTFCKKEGTDYWGEISVLKNGSPWEVRIRAESTTFSNAKSTIFVKTFDKDGVLSETLTFFKVPS
ncbi:MAG: hypothetical protein ABL927_14595, partial [Bdellovibrionales bacterium]